MTDINTWSPTDASNNHAPPAGWPEGQLPSTVNDSARAMMGGLRRWYERANCSLDATGTANVITLAYPVVPTPVPGDAFLFAPTYTNTGPTTLDVGTGPLPIRFGSAALRGGELQASVLVWVIFGGDGYWYMSAAAGGPTVSGLPLGASLGTPNAQTVTYATGAPTTLTAGDRFTFYPLVATNTGPVTLNVQGLGVYHVLTGGAECVGGELKQYVVVDVVWDGTHYALLGGVSPGTYLPLTGGVVNGTLSAPQYNLSGVRFAARSGNSNQIYDGDGGDAISCYGAAGGNSNYYDADQHQFRLNDGTLIATVNSTGLGVNGQVAVNGQVTGTSMSSPTITATSMLNATAIQVGGINFVNQTGPLRTIFDTGGTPNFTMYTTGENYYDNQSHNFRSRGGSSAYAIFDGTATYNVSGSWLTISDVALKEHVEIYNRGLDACLKLQPVSYRYAAGTLFADEAGTTRYGLVAQDVETVVPEMVGETTLGGERVSTIDPGQLTWLLLNAVKELAARITALEGESDV